MSREQRLIHRIYALMLTEPDRAWSYEELGRRLGARQKIVCARCLELVEEKKITKVLIGSGKPRGRTARVSIRHDGEYPGWLMPQPKELAHVVVLRHVMHDDEDDDE